MAAVVPAKAGTHNHRLGLLRAGVGHLASAERSRGMGPCFRRDDRIPVDSLPLLIRLVPVQNLRNRVVKPSLVELRQT